MPTRHLAHITSRTLRSKLAPYRASRSSNYIQDRCRRLDPFYLLHQACSFHLRIRVGISARLTFTMHLYPHNLTSKHLTECRLAALQLATILSTTTSNLNFNSRRRIISTPPTRIRGINTHLLHPLRMPDTHNQLNMGTLGCNQHRMIASRRTSSLDISRSSSPSLHHDRHIRLHLQSPVAPIRCTTPPLRRPHGHRLSHPNVYCRISSMHSQRRHSLIASVCGRTRDVLFRSACLLCLTDRPLSPLVH